MIQSATPFDTRWMLHLGLGAFHRAHQAWYIERLLRSGETEWALACGNLRPDMPQLLDDLQAQGGRYTLETVSPDGRFSYQQIGAIGRLLRWSAGLDEIVEAGRQPQTRIISFTVTEAGYYLDAQRRLQLDHPDLQADLAQREPRTIYGAMRAILGARRDDGAGPVTLLSCDNLRSNGSQFRRGLLEFLGHAGDAGLLAWVQANTSCPDSMVDRITPRPPAALAKRVLEATGRDDRCAVTAEEFCQWVIEDRFVHGRPALERVGAQFVPSVAPYEEAKIRILNGSHSCLAWAGALAGHAYIHQALADPAIRAMAWHYISDDVIPCLSPSPVDLPAYRDTVLERFANPYIRDTVERVAADGFAKFPGFIAPTIRERRLRGAPFESSAVLAALFLLFLQRQAAGKVAFPCSDKAFGPDDIARLVAAPDPVRAFCASTVLWGAQASDPVLEAAVRAAHGALLRSQPA